MGFHHDALEQIATPMHMDSSVGAGEAVDLVLTDGSTESVQAIVALPSSFKLEDVGTEQIIRGNVVLEAAHAAKVNVTKALVISGWRFEIESFGRPESGYVKLTVNRTTRETSRASSALDPL